MKKIADFLVDKRIWLFTVGIVFAAVCAVFMNFVNINKDLTKYLAEDSDMRKGLEIMEAEFPAAELPGTFKIMFEHLTDTQKLRIKEELSEFDGVSEVQYEADSIDYNTKSYTLYVVNTVSSDADDVEELIDEITQNYKDKYTVHTYYNGNPTGVLDILIPLAVSLLLIVLLILCKSYFEPVLLVASIALAIVMNMGTNIIFESVSDMTFSIAAVLQLVLSIDYSIMLLHRYQQERAILEGKDNPLAMKRAIVNAFSSIAGSAITTIVGLLVLLFMSFTIGKDIGLVLSKGVLLSFICVFTVMPTLILWSDKLLIKTNKATLKAKRAESKKEAQNV